MSKYEQEPERSVKDFVESLDEQSIRDTHTLIDMMQRISGCEPKLWNAGTLGFDTYHYKYESGREGDCQVIGFYPRSNKITIYLMDGTDRHTELLGRLGKHTISKVCLYIKRLDGIDLTILEQILKDSYDNTTQGKYIH